MHESLHRACTHVTVVRRIPAPASAHRSRQPWPGRRDLDGARQAGRDRGQAAVSSAAGTATSSGSSSTPRSTPGSTSSTPPTSTRPQSEEIVATRWPQASATTSCSRPNRLYDGRGSEPARGVPPRDHPRRRGLVAAAEHRLDRPISDKSPGSEHGHRRATRDVERSRPPGQDPLPRTFDLSASHIVEAQ